MTESLEGPGAPPPPGSVGKTPWVKSDMNNWNYISESEIGSVIANEVKETLDKALYELGERSGDDILEEALAKILGQRKPDSEIERALADTLEKALADVLETRKPESGMEEALADILEKALADILETGSIEMLEARQPKSEIEKALVDILEQRKSGEEIKEALTDILETMLIAILETRQPESEMEKALVDILETRLVRREHNKARAEILETHSINMREKLTLEKESRRKTLEDAVRQVKYSEKSHIEPEEDARVRKGGPSPTLKAFYKAVKAIQHPRNVPMKIFASAVRSSLFVLEGIGPHADPITRYVLGEKATAASMSVLRGAGEPGTRRSKLKNVLADAAALFELPKCFAFYSMQQPLRKKLTPAKG